MKKKKKAEVIVDSQREGADLSFSTPSISESAAPEQAPAPRKKKRAAAFFRVLFTVIFSLLFAVSMLLLVLLMFIHALSANTAIPDIGMISGEWLTMFLGAWYPLAIGGALAALFLLAVILLNLHRIRRMFLAVGCSTVSAAAACVAAIFLRMPVLHVLSGEWQDALVNATAAFGDFCVVCAMILAMVGAACFSIYSCIVVIKGGKHEKDS